MPSLGTPLEHTSPKIRTGSDDSWSISQKYVCGDFYTLIADAAKRWTIDHIRAILTWLDNWPIGLKLNTQLSQFICVCSISIIDIWLRKATFID